MPKTDYKIFEALNPFFKVVLKGLKGLVDGEHYFDTFAKDAIFESRYHSPDWPSTIRGRANLMASLSGSVLSGDQRAGSNPQRCRQEQSAGVQVHSHHVDTVGVL